MWDNAERIGPLERVGSGDKQASTSRISADLFVFPFLLTDAFLFCDRRVLLGCLAAWLPRCLAALLPRCLVGCLAGWLPRCLAASVPPRLARCRLAASVSRFHDPHGASGSRCHTTSSGVDPSVENGNVAGPVRTRLPTQTDAVAARETASPAHAVA